LAAGRRTGPGWRAGDRRGTETWLAGRRRGPGGGLVIGVALRLGSRGCVYDRAADGGRVVGW